MKNLLCRVLSLALCAALACALPAFAAEAEAPAADAPAHMAPVRVWGRVTRQEDGSLLLRNSDQNDPNREIVVHLAEATPVVDAVTGLPLDAAKIRDGDTVYAWVGPAMTMSLPPQASAVVVVGNLPADGAAPQYYEITGLDQTATIAIYPPPPRTAVNLPVAGGEVLTIPVSAQVTPWLTKNIVTLDDLTPGTRVLVWRDSAKTVSRVLVLGNNYRGYMSWYPGGAVFVNGSALSASCKVVDGETLLPIRAVAEAVGLDVEWRPGTGAVVSQNGESVLEAMPGGRVAFSSGGSSAYACVLENGITYVSPEALILPLHLFPVCDA
nr:stalk domain-containing protein [uncultured Oscillibacter sp.]